MVNDYEKQVYAAVLGKVLGVYMGRPVEGWTKETLEEKMGFLDHYVHRERVPAVPLIVADDDISGTLTFVRALEDSGLYADTPDEFYGETWLNYLLEGQTILWWGGMGFSTEHTAYLRLKAGVKSPRSGAMELNGKLVAEQIGAQIFIDGFGMVCPGQPELAARLARKAARVSHDGEAVNAAVVVAAMEAAAFVEKDMEKLLDIGISQIPADSLIARLHRDVRQWCREDGDWRRTFERIKERYGYRLYGGNCHVVPNHALMVMAWAYAPRDFRRALSIVNTCGWDTDCNSANVGCLMALVVGLDAICDGYDYRTPVADRILLPTADGTNCVTDCLTEARKIAAMGRRVMGWPALPPALHWMDFSERGAAQGFMPEPVGRGVSMEHTWREDGTASGARFQFRMPAGGVARVSVPLLARMEQLLGGYDVVATPKIYSGMTVQAAIDNHENPAAETLLFVRYMTETGKTEMAYSAERTKDGVLTMTVPDTKGFPVMDLGVEVRNENPCQGALTFQYVDLDASKFAVHADRLCQDRRRVPGWITDVDFIHGAFSNDDEELLYFGKNTGKGFAYTGNRYWRDQIIEARINVHLASQGGLICRCQGTRRYLSLTRRGNRLVLAREFYGESILAECPVDWALDEVRQLKLSCQGTKITAWLDGCQVLSAQDDRLADGAAGFVFEDGTIGVTAVSIRSGE